MKEKLVLWVFWVLQLFKEPVWEPPQADAVLNEWEELLPFFTSYEASVLSQYTPLVGKMIVLGVVRKNAEELLTVLGDTRQSLYNHVHYGGRLDLPKAALTDRYGAVNVTLDEFLTDRNRRPFKMTEFLAMLQQELNWMAEIFALDSKRRPGKQYRLFNRLRNLHAEVSNVKEALRYCSEVIDER